MRFLSHVGNAKWITVACLAALVVAITVVATATAAYLDLKGSLARSLEADTPEQTPADAADDPSTKDKSAGIGATDFFLPNREPQLSVTLVGLYKDMAMLAQGNDVQTARVGESVLGVKVLAIHANGVDIEWNGKTMPLTLFPTMPTAGPPSPGGGPPPDPPPGVVIAPPPGMPVGPPSGPPPGIRPERGGRGGMRERLRNMSAEERRQFRERYENMSEEERAEFRQQTGE